MAEKRRTFETDVHTLQKMSLQPLTAKEKAIPDSLDNPQPEESPASLARVALSRELLMRLINRLKVS